MIKNYFKLCILGLAVVGNAWILSACSKSDNPKSTVDAAYATSGSTGAATASAAASAR
jgi:hypothetical protein